MSFKSFKGGVMSNVVDINKLRVDAIYKKIKKQEDLIEKAHRSPLISLAELAIYMFELRIKEYKQEIQQIQKKEKKNAQRQYRSI